ncbi:hypothetical protein E3N88_21374 [Mikania micrantha]|uniref:Avr9/Cf-9 rapidly elicited protein 146 n=1 Tax=Mikania micrantha TaxID=192012 RepID=A0A5N6NJN4_9ASTR|nr:hypothetical protein E3N88_21374 [Mikania micrantha]
MEQNLPVAAKKVWSVVRAMLFMIKKNISKRKLLLDLNMLMKRGKIAGQALQNLIFYHHHHWSASAFNHRSHHSPNFTFPPPPTEDYEFSCSNSPVNPLSLFTTNKKHHNFKKDLKKKSVITNENDHNEYDRIFVDPAVIKALEMLTSAAASPAVHGFGKSPVVRQLRITDSPFPLCNGEEDSYVDEAAEKFIMKFYNELRRQN